ncbi:hypothetical protein F6X54_10215 [Micromonospora aurantiaca]|uniref:Uncharacterized protein n=1 Tax=Micromonospora aurantiaca (nom. illeg.) TaxID=47850 RepID=A0ABQ6UJL1_9ACTN|nr:hypothetical protein [Micromonospora aurantiaca]KAB1116848.1 hypothetical protein F6X54_10215 [Micromonospora aurantiaca]
MLQNTWYLADADWFADLSGAPRLATDDEAVIGQLTQLFNDESYFDPAMTVAATRVMLLALEHLGDTMTYGVQTHDLTELARLLCGLNLVQAHLTQTVQRIAERVNARTFVGLDEAPSATVRALTESLSTAGANGEVFAGHLKEAHMGLRNVTK